jgi:chromosome partitioning protein
MFANELLARGCARNKILFVINRSNDSEVALKDAQSYISGAGFTYANTDLPDRVGYQNAMNIGRALSESLYSTLSDRAENLATEIVSFVNQLQDHHE